MNPAENRGGGDLSNQARLAAVVDRIMPADRDPGAIGFGALDYLKRHFSEFSDDLELIAAGLDALATMRPTMRRWRRSRTRRGSGGWWSSWPRASMPTPAMAAIAAPVRGPWLATNTGCRKVRTDRGGRMGNGPPGTPARSTMT